MCDANPKTNLVLFSLSYNVPIKRNEIYYDSTVTNTNTRIPGQYSLAYGIKKTNRK